MPAGSRGRWKTWELTEKSSAPMEQLCVRRSALYGSICVPQI